MREDDGMTLVEFLLGRIAEDEAAATDTGESRWEWYELPDPGPNRWRMTGVGIPDDDMGHRTETMFRSDAKHIARHDPARVLAECEAKRRIVLGAQDRERGAALAPAEDEMIAEARLTAGNLYDDVMRHLAAVYADHPDFREEWRP